MITINTQRIDESVLKAEQELNLIKEFRNTHIDIINQNLSLFEAFLKQFNGSNLILDNMYNRGISLNENSTLTVHVTFNLNKELKNTTLLAKKMEINFKLLFCLTNIRAEFRDYKINSNSVKFELYIK